MLICFRDTSDWLGNKLCPYLDGNTVEEDHYPGIARSSVTTIPPLQCQHRINPTAHPMAHFSFGLVGALAD